MTDLASLSYRSGEEAFVVLMPGRIGGRPTIGHRRLSTENIADYYWDSGFDEVCDAYELTTGEVMVAVWYEAQYGTRSRRKRWKDWYEANSGPMYSPTHYGPPAVPPTKDDSND